MKRVALRGKLLRAVGRIHSAVCKLPGGKAAVRGLSRGMAPIAFRLPAFGLHKRGSVDEIGADMIRLGQAFHATPVITKQEADSVELTLGQCPYGFNRRDQQGACTAVMELDRSLVRRCGGRLTVEETIPGGASACRVTLTMAGPGSR